jgi:hypothetical protein
MTENYTHAVPVGGARASATVAACASVEASATADLDRISGLALGTLLCYVKDFGTPYQSARAGCILDCLLAFEQDPTLMKQGGDSKAREILSSVGGISDGGVDWQALRQHLYEIAGDWLWAHAVTSFRHTTAIDEGIPHSVREEALRLINPIAMDDEKILNNQDAKQRGYFSFGGYVFPGSEEYYQQGDDLSDVENR